MTNIIKKAMNNLKMIGNSEIDFIPMRSDIPTNREYEILYEVEFCDMVEFPDDYGFIDTFCSYEEAEDEIRQWMIEDRKNGDPYKYRIRETVLLLNEDDDDEEGYNPHYMTLADIGMRESDF